MLRSYQLQIFYWDVFFTFSGRQLFRNKDFVRRAVDNQIETSDTIFVTNLFAPREQHQTYDGRSTTFSSEHWQNKIDLKSFCFKRQSSAFSKFTTGRGHFDRAEFWRMLQINLKSWPADSLQSNWENATILSNAIFKSKEEPQKLLDTQGFQQFVSSRKKVNTHSQRLKHFLKNPPCFIPDKRPQSLYSRGS